MNSVATTKGLIQFIKGFLLLEWNEVIITNYRSYIIDINLEEYFQDQFTKWDEINKIILNLSRKSYHIKFVKYIEELIEAYHLQDYIN